MYLGLDASTQSLSACLIDADSFQILHECSLRYDEALPSYGTVNGVIPPESEHEAMAPPLMWIAALDLLFQQMKDEHIPLDKVRAVSGSGQQHGSVYMNRNMPELLHSLQPQQSLAEQLEPGLSRKLSPIWMDSSTTAECAAITAAAGGDQQVLDITGSTAFERFTAAQILKFARRNPEAYARTAEVGLVSSFHASVLAGDPAPIDWGDGSGMNLLDMRTRTWSETMCRAVSADLQSKLPPCTPPWEIIGRISPYFVQKYQMNPDCAVVNWSGDNPNSLIGLGMFSESTAAVSLGTSDTYFGIMSEYRTDPAAGGHVFIAPTGDYMSLICFKNGSLAREAVRNRFDLTWDEFSEQINTIEPGNHSFMMLPYFTSEIVPHVTQPGIVRHRLPEDSTAANCRAVIEAQMMSMKIHSSWMNVSPERIYATGGASRNTAILQVMADVFQADIIPGETGNTAALGAALRAAHAAPASQENVSWQAIRDRLGGTSVETVITPRPEFADFYGKLSRLYRELEQTHLAGNGR